MTNWWIPGLVLLGAGLLLIGVGVPLVLGRVGRNRVYGYRIPRTLRDDRIWYPVNALTGLWMIWGGLLAAVIGALLVLLRNREEAAQLVLAIGVPALIICLAVGIYKGWKLARLIDEQLHIQEQRTAGTAGQRDENQSG
jgi:uncharacterized membrane protein